MTLVTDDLVTATQARGRHSSAPTNGRADRKTALRERQGTMNKHRIGALVAAAALTLTFAGTAFAATYAEVTGHTAHSSDANSESYWGDNCSKSEWNGEDETYVLEHDYALVVVKSGSGEFANTEFANASAGETVWADVNGNGVYVDDDKGIDRKSVV